jgi:hypothetical protein
MTLCHEDKTTASAIKASATAIVNSHQATKTSISIKDKASVRPKKNSTAIVQLISGTGISH